VWCVRQQDNRASFINFIWAPVASEIRNNRVRTFAYNRNIRVHKINSNRNIRVQTFVSNRNYRVQILVSNRNYRVQILVSNRNYRVQILASNRNILCAYYCFPTGNIRGNQYQCCRQLLLTELIVTGYIIFIIIRVCYICLQ
jgi:hypothetical protein